MLPEGLDDEPPLPDDLRSDPLLQDRDTHTAPEAEEAAGRLVPDRGVPVVQEVLQDPDNLGAPFRGEGGEASGTRARSGRRGGGWPCHRRR